jgi:hypothetical protein
MSTRVKIITKIATFSLLKRKTFYCKFVAVSCVTIQYQSGAREQKEEDLEHFRKAAFASRIQI